MERDVQLGPIDEVTDEVIWEINDEASRVLNSLNAETLSEQQMHACARVALLNLLASDNTIDHIHWTRMHTTEFGRAIFNFVEQLDQCAKTLKLENAGAFLGVVKQ